MSDHTLETTDIITTGKRSKYGRKNTKGDARRKGSDSSKEVTKEWNM